MNDIKVNIISGGLGRQTPLADGVSGLVCTAPAIVGGMQNGVNYRLESLEDAVGLGIDEAYDTSVSFWLHENIKEYFSNPQAAPLWLRSEAPGIATTFADLINPAGSAVTELIAEADGEIFQLGVYYYDPLGANVASQMVARIADAQSICVNSFKYHRPLHIILSANHFLFADEINLRLQNSQHVSILIGGVQDIADQTYTPIGLLLGTISAARVNECVAWVGKFDVSGGNVQVPTIDNVKYNDIATSVLNGLNDSGYIFLRTHTGRSGVYFNDSHTCTSINDDFAYIENNRTINKAAVLIRQSLLPYLNSPINLDPATGKIAADVVKAIEAVGRKRIEIEMLRTGELSGFSFTIDHNQNILATSILQCELMLTPTGVAREIRVNLGFENPFN